MTINELKQMRLAQRVAELMGTAHKAQRRKVRCLSCGTEFLSTVNRTCDVCRAHNANMGWRHGSVKPV